MQYFSQFSKIERNNIRNMLSLTSHESFIPFLNGDLFWSYFSPLFENCEAINRFTLTIIGWRYKQLVGI